MIELERKASTPGEGLSHSERSEWHKLNARSGYMEELAEIDAPLIAADYPAANRYLDSPAWKAR